MYVRVGGEGMQCCKQTLCTLGYRPHALGRSLWGTGRQRNAEQLLLCAFRNCLDCFMFPSEGLLHLHHYRGVYVCTPVWVHLVGGTLPWTGNKKACGVAWSSSWEEGKWWMQSMVLCGHPRPCGILGDYPVLRVSVPQQLMVLRGSALAELLDPWKNRWDPRSMRDERSQETWAG